MLRSLIIMGAAPAVFTDLEPIFQNLVDGVFALGGLACFVFLLIGGFNYLTAGGDDKAIQAAKNTLTWAIIGLVVIFGAWGFLDQVLRHQVLQYPAGIRFDIPH